MTVLLLQVTNVDSLTFRLVPKPGVGAQNDVVDQNQVLKGARVIADESSKTVVLDLCLDSARNA
ncbi:hypothetical protein FRC18_007319 [Serendipita sp. 400]|nr:hypothetical protein FRC18_007319 [Serendipita sp. 400]